MTVTLDELRALEAKATPGPWGRGFWSGQCHLHETGKHPGAEAGCKYDWTMAHDEDGEVIFDNPHRFSSLTVPETVAGNYDYEEGGIIRPEDAAFIVAAVQYVRDALSVEGREAQIAAIDAALRAVDQRIVAAYPETAVELLPGDEQGRHDYAAALYDAGVRFRPSETLDLATRLQDSTR